MSLSKPPLGSAQADADRPDGATAVVIVDEEQSGEVSPQDDASDLPTVNEDNSNEDRISNDSNILLDPEILTDQVTLAFLFEWRLV